MSKSDEKPKRALTAQEKQYVKLRLTGATSTEAARIAGYSKPPTNHIVNRAIAKSLAHQQAHLDNLRGKLVETLVDIAFGDPRELMHWEDGGIDIKKSRELTPSQAAMVSSVTYDTKGNVQVKFENKWKAMELLSKFAALAETQQEKLTIEGPTGWVDMVRAAAVAATSGKKEPLSAKQATEQYVDVLVGSERAALEAPSMPGAWEDDEE